MKKLIVIAAGIALLYLNRGSIHALLTASPDFAAQHEEQVVLYGTSWCGGCKKARAYFAQHNISYFEYDIEQSSEGYRQYKQLHGNGTPLLLIGTNVVRGFDPRAIEQALRQ